MLRTLALPLVLIAAGAATSVAEPAPPGEASAPRDPSALAAGLLATGADRGAGIAASLLPLAKGRVSDETAGTLARALTAATQGASLSAEDATRLATSVSLVLARAGDSAPASDAVEEAHGILAAAGSDPGETAALKALLQAIAVTGRPPGLEASEALDRPAAASAPQPRAGAAKKRRAHPAPRPAGSTP